MGYLIYFSYLKTYHSTPDFTTCIILIIIKISYNIVGSKYFRIAKHFINHEVIKYLKRMETTVT